MSHAIPLPAVTPRALAAMCCAALTTVTLLVMMMRLVQPTGAVPEPTPTLRFVDFVRPLEEVDPKPRDRVDPPPPVEPFPDPPRIRADPVRGGGPGLTFDKPAPEPLDLRGSAGMPDGDMLPIVRVAPSYPPRAITLGIEGYVVVEFDVDERGAVLNPRVMYADPEGIFDRSALRAVLKYKYKPRVVDGQAVRVSGVRQRVTYELSSR